MKVPGENLSEFPGVLTAYFSWSGSSEKTAFMIQADKKTDLFHIETSKKYPKSYAMAVAISRKEKTLRQRPELVEKPKNMDRYRKIVLVYPCWWYTCPMAVFSFLDSFETANKELYPICLNGGSGLGTSRKDLIKLYPNAMIKEGLAISGTLAGSAQARKDILEYLKDFQ